MTTFLPNCRHRDPKSPPGICELKHGVLVCPCLGRNAKPVARLSVDDAGQLIWTALDDKDQPTAHFTLVALRRQVDGRTQQVRLTPVADVPLSTLNSTGFFSVQPQGESTPVTITVKEFMERTLQGDEFVYL